MGCVNSHVHLKKQLLSNFDKVQLVHQKPTIELPTSVYKMRVICQYWKRTMHLTSLITPLMNTIIEYARVPYLFDKTRAIKRAENNYVYKLALVGDQAIGKSSVFFRFIEFKYSDRYKPTVTVDQDVMMVNIKGDAVALWICDCSGDPARHVKSYNRSLYKKARGILLVFDITNRESFEHVKEEYKLLSKQQKNKKRSVVMLVGTKCDLEKDRKVSIPQAQRLAKQLGCMDYMEVSAKENINIKLCFSKLVYAIYDIDQFQFDLNKPWMYPCEPKPL
eukprot:14764_1